MIFAHSSDKSKCNLGELSDLPDSSKTPFENIAKVQANKTWQFIGRILGLNSVNINKNSWNVTEFMLVITYVDGHNVANVISCNVPAIALTTIIGGVSLHLGDSDFHGHVTESFDGNEFQFIFSDLTLNNVSVASLATVDIYIKE